MTGRRPPPTHEILGLGCARAGFRPDELWTGYVALGGNDASGQIRSYLMGSSVPSLTEYDVLVHCLNERLLELGAEGRLP